MTKARYRINSRLHQTLMYLRMMPRSDKELFKMLFFTESMKRLEESVFTPLVSDGFVKRSGPVYSITTAGEEKLAELGAIKKQLAKISKSQEFRALEPSDYKKASVRPGADDHELCPSRIGNTLYYRDGRVEGAHV